MKAPPVELRPRVPGAFDLFIHGSWLGTIQYIWDRWRYTYLGRSMSLEEFQSPQEAITALLAFHVARLRSADEEEPHPAFAPRPEMDL